MALGLGPPRACRGSRRSPLPPRSRSPGLNPAPAGPAPAPAPCPHGSVLQSATAALRGLRGHPSRALGVARGGRAARPGPGPGPGGWGRRGPDPSPSGLRPEPCLLAAQSRPEEGVAAATRPAAGGGARSRAGGEESEPGNRPHAPRTEA